MVRVDDFKYRFISQPGGWVGEKTHSDAPILVNLRLDPFEHMAYPEGNIGNYEYFGDWFLYEFWRFVFVQQEVTKRLEAAIEFPPMQKGASFNLDAVKAKIAEAMAAQSK